MNNPNNFGRGQPYEQPQQPYNQPPPNPNYQNQQNYQQPPYQQPPYQQQGQTRRKRGPFGFLQNPKVKELYINITSILMIFMILYGVLTFIMLYLETNDFILWFATDYFTTTIVVLVILFIVNSMLKGKKMKFNAQPNRGKQQSMKFNIPDTYGVRGQGFNLQGNQQQGQQNQQRQPQQKQQFNIPNYFGQKPQQRQQQPRQQPRQQTNLNIPNTFGQKREPKLNIPNTMGGRPQTFRMTGSIKCPQCGRLIVGSQCKNCGYRRQ